MNSELHSSLYALVFLGRSIMNYKEIASKITGISCPIFGISWNPSKSEQELARRIVTYLEDRRVLYSPSELEIPEHCVHSVLSIRDFLTASIQELDKSSSLSDHLRAMRAACRKFLNHIEDPENTIVENAHSYGHYAGWIFFSALGELRSSFGIHIAMIASKYGVNVENDLAVILPVEDLQ